MSDAAYSVVTRKMAQEIVRGLNAQREYVQNANMDRRIVAIHCNIGNTSYISAIYRSEKTGHILVCLGKKGYENYFGLKREVYEVEALCLYN